MRASRYWLPVDQYIGGIEHAILHLLYSRFWTRVMRELGMVGFKEPFANYFAQGMVLNEVFFRKPDAGRVEYFNPADVEVTLDPTAQRRIAVLRADGLEVESGGVVTMSKSKNNGVDPQALVDEFGADTARLFTMFAAPPEQTLEWSDEGVQGASRFIKRLWKAVHDHVRQGAPAPLDKSALTDAERSIRRQAHHTLAKITDDIGRRRTFNTAIAAAMELLNALAKFPQSSPQDRAVMQEALEIAVLGLSPIIPHVTHALWKALGHSRVADRRAVDAGRCRRPADLVDHPGRAGQRQAARSYHRGRRGRRSDGARRGARRAACAEVHRRGRSAKSHHRAG